MSTRISHIPFYGRIPISAKWLYLAGFLYLVPVALAFAWRPWAGMALLAAPLCILLVNHGPAVIYVLVAATFLFLPFETIVTILPADIIAFLLAITYGIDLLLRGPARYRNKLTSYYLIFLAVALLSIALEGFTGLSVRYFLRQVLIFVTFMGIAHFGRRLKVRFVFYIFVATAILNSLYSLAEFLGASGSIRAFGVAGPGYGDHVMLAFLVSSIYFLWTDDLRSRILWGTSVLILMGALAATQTRASTISAGWGLVVVVIMVWRMARAINYRIPTRSIKIAVVAALILLPIIAAYTPLFEGIAHRFGRIGLSFSGTLFLRLILWEAAVKAFLANPVFGIGAGNFPLIYQWVADIKFEPAYYLVSGLGTHVVFLNILTETGVVGLCSAFLLLGRALKSSYNIMTMAEDKYRTREGIAMFVMVVAIIGSSFYSGAWFWGNNSYHLAIVLGLVAANNGKQ